MRIILGTIIGGVVGILLCGLMYLQILKRGIPEFIAQQYSENGDIMFAIFKSDFIIFTVIGIVCGCMIGIVMEIMKDKNAKTPQ